jgi:hypothetical protein
MEMLQLYNDRIAVQEIIIRAATAIDLQDWDMLRTCLMDAILTDYGDLRGNPPTITPADDYVVQRREALAPLKTQHLSSNHLIVIDGDTARCSSQMVIYRRKQTDNGMVHFDTHCHYEHTLQRTESGWKIASIKQTVLWNEGDSSIHSGAKKS